MIKHKLPKSLGQYFRKAQNIFKKNWHLALLTETFDWSDNSNNLENCSNQQFDQFGPFIAI